VLWLYIHTYTYSIRLVSKPTDLGFEVNVSDMSAEAVIIFDFTCISSLYLIFFKIVKTNEHQQTLFFTNKHASNRAQYVPHKAGYWSKYKDIVS